MIKLYDPLIYISCFFSSCLLVPPKQPPFFWSFFQRLVSQDMATAETAEKLRGQLQRTGPLEGWGCGIHQMGRIETEA